MINTTSNQQYSSVYLFTFKNPNQIQLLVNSTSKRLIIFVCIRVIKWNFDGIGCIIYNTFIHNFVIFFDCCFYFWLVFEWKLEYQWIFSSGTYSAINNRRLIYIYSHTFCFYLFDVGVYAVASNVFIDYFWFFRSLVHHRNDILLDILIFIFEFLFRPVFFV